MSEGVSSHVTGAVLYLHSPDRPYANRYKWVKKELLFHAGGLSAKQPRLPRLTATRPFPFSIPHKLDFLLLLLYIALFLSLLRSACSFIFKAV